MYKALLFSGFLLSSFLITAQMQIIPASSQALDPEELASCGIISNEQITGNCDAIGTFYYDGYYFPVSQGIALSSGYVVDLVGPNNSTNKTGNLGLGGDSLLQTLSTDTTLDAIVYEFDIETQGLLEFTYIFGSEEYPEFVMTLFNDVFGIFVSGPIPGGGFYQDHNIAVIPDTLLPINVNNINQNINSSYYVNNNTASQMYGITQLDGLTVPMKASLPTIVGETYHVTIGVADVEDHSYDCGVFIWPSSLPEYNVSYHSAFGSGDQIFESLPANQGFIRISKIVQAYTTDTVLLDYSGTAINGIDCNLLPDTVIIPMLDYYVDVPITIVLDTLSEGTELLSVAALHGCSAPMFHLNLEIIEPWQLVGGIIEDEITICDLGAAFVETEVNAADSLLNFAWSHGDTLADVYISSTVPQASWYFVTITDSENNQLEDSIKITFPIPIDVDLQSDPAECIYDYVDLTVLAGTGPFSYQWSNGAVSEDLDTVVATGPSLFYSFSVDVTDTYGCTFPFYTNVFIAPELSLTLNPQYQCDSVGGAISANVLMGIPPYNYEWSNGVAINTFTTTDPGNYVLTVTDNHGCVVIDSVFFNPVPLQVDFSSNDIGCLPGLMQADVISGADPITFSWSDPSFVGNTIELYAAGQYSLTITDDNNCSLDTSFSIAMDTTFFLDGTVSTYFDSCAVIPGVLSAVGFGGAAPYSYEWSTGDTGAMLAQVVPGSYQVSITDAVGCMVVRFVEMLPFDFFNFAMEQVVVSNCNNLATGSLWLEYAGGVGISSMQWSNGASSDSIGNLQPGWYTVSITDYCGSQYVDSIELQFQSTIDYSISKGEVLCDGTLEYLAIDFVPNSNYLLELYLDSVLVSPDFASDSIGAQVYRLLAVGAYTLQVSDTFACTVAELLSVDEVLSPASGIISDKGDTLCGAQLVKLVNMGSNPVGNTNYRVDTVSINPFSYGSGTYIQNLTNDGVFGGFPIGFNFKFFGKSYNQFYVGVNGWISFTPQHEYSIADPKTNVSLPAMYNDSNLLLPANTIFGAWTDWDYSQFGFIKYHTYGVSPNRILVVSFLQGVYENCAGTSNEFSIYLYETSNIIDVDYHNINNCYSGFVNKTAGIQNGTRTRAYYLDTLNNNPWTAHQLYVRYEPGNKWLDANWNEIGFGDSLTIQVDSTTTFYTEVAGCDGISYDSLTIFVFDTVPAVSLGNDFDLCNDETAELTAPAGYSYLWNTGEQTQSITADTTATYTVALTTSAGCVGDASIAVTHYQVDDIILIDSLFSCPSDALIPVDPLLGPIWQDGTSNYPYIAQESGVFNCFVYYGSCMYADTVYVELFDLPVADFSYYANGTEIVFNNASVFADSYAWDFGDGSAIDTSVNPVHTFPAGDYEVVLTATNECGDSTHTELFQFLDNALEQHQWGIIAYPNPAKDVVHIQAKLPLANNYSIELYNAIGQKVYRKTVINDHPLIETQMRVDQLVDGLYTLVISQNGYSQNISLLIGSN